MKKKSLLVLLFSLFFLVACSDKPEEEDDSLKCPVGKESSYQKVSSSSFEYHDLIPGKGYYGRGSWSIAAHIQTKGSWLFDAGDAPVNVKYSSKCEDNVSAYIQIRPQSKKGTPDGWEKISNPSEGFTVPANYTCEVEYTSNYWSPKGDTCFEFYLYCCEE